MIRSRNSQPSSGQRGYALMLVFVMAAAVALMLYQQMPRVAFETQRDKELLLIERGNQFKRAIQLYYVINKKWPSKIEDLENTNDKRYLRRRYVDPMTGKDEWRLIHTNGMLLTDSLVQKPPDPAGDKNGDKSKDLLASTSNGGTSATDPNAPPDVNAAVLRRPSDRNFTPGSSGQQPGLPDPNDPNAVAAYLAQQAQNPQNGQPGQQLLPGQLQPGQQGLLPGQPGFNPQFPGQGIPGQPGMPGVPNPNMVRIGPDGQMIPVTNQPGQVLNSQTGGNAGQQGQFPGAPGAGPGQNGIVAPNNAVNMINQMLTTPRQAPTNSNSPFQSQLNGGLGLAGVASKYEGPSIIVYADRQKYNEWEFVFDLKNNTLGGQQIGGPGLGGPGRPGGPGVPPIAPGVPPPIPPPPRQ
jgi:hypothetical protein